MPAVINFPLSSPNKAIPIIRQIIDIKPKTAHITAMIFFVFSLTCFSGTNAEDMLIIDSPKISISISITAILLLAYRTEDETETADVVVFLEHNIIIFGIYGAETVASEFFYVAFAVV